MSSRAQSFGRAIDVDQYLDVNGVLYIWDKIKKYVDEHSSEGISGPISWDDILGKPNLVTEDIMNSAINNAVSSVYRYCGSVSTYANLPIENLSGGDVYNVNDTDMNYAWVKTDGGGYWDPLGSTFKIEPIPNSVIQQIVDGTYGTEEP